MFWGSFSYNKKGPCFIWRPETAQEKKAAQKELDEINAELEAECKRKWELETAMRRLDITRNKRGSKPTWKFTEKTGKLTRRKGAGGVD